MDTNKTFKRIVLCIFLMAGILLPSLTCYASPNVASTLTPSGNGYSSVIYDNTKGLPTSDANAIAQTDDGFLWIGSYSGLIRYDSSSFLRINSMSGITSVISLYADSNKNLWIGTNDNGVAVMTRGRLNFYNKKDGLSSQSVQAITEDDNGNMYFATTKGLCMLDRDQKISSIDDENIAGHYIKDVRNGSDGLVYGVTNTGDIFTVKNGTMHKFYPQEKLGIRDISVVLPDENNPGYVYIGTLGSSIYYGRLTNSFEPANIYDISPLSGTNSIKYLGNKIWVCTDYGFCSIDKNGVRYYNFDLNISIEDIMNDYQGNLWIASSKQGVMKIVPNQFTDVTKKYALPSAVVTSTCYQDGKLFIGTKNQGLQVTSLYGSVSTIPLTNAVFSTGESIDETDLIKMLEGTTIRSIILDQDNAMWLSTYSDYGLIKYKDGIVVCYNEDSGLPTSRVRTIFKFMDGTVVVATSTGLAKIYPDGQVVSYDELNSILNANVLAVSEGMGGDIIVSTDGDGIYICREDGISHITTEEGLSSDIVMRVKFDHENDIFWVITSNAICYLDKYYESTVVSNFPYSNNFDIQFDDKGNSWVLSSNGIYVVPTDSLINNDSIDPILFDYDNGLQYTTTANSYSWLNSDGTLYIAGSSGVCKVNINSDTRIRDEIRVSTPYLEADGTFIYPDADGSFTVPKNTNKLTINCYIFTYAFSNPEITYYLDGFDNTPYTTQRSEWDTVSYTNLPGGTYHFIMDLTDYTGESLGNYDLTIKKEKTFWEYTLSKFLIVCASIAILGFIIVRLMHITIISRQYEQIRLAKEEAEKANTAKSRFLANMSHEIRTPINTIIGMNEMIMREDADNVPDDYHKAITGYSANIGQASEVLLVLINELLDLSKIESGKMELIEQEYDTKELLSSICNMIRVRADKKDLTFSTEVDANLPLKLYGDVNKLREILLNILTNAVKYTEQGGFTLISKIESRSSDSCRIYFAVKDTGIGIKQEDISKLFTTFRRLEEVKNSGIQGTGLGLDLSHQYVEIMGGELKCDSVYGEGSTFYFTIEQKIKDVTPIGAFEFRNEHKETAKYIPKFTAPDCHILVVDDNEMNLQVMKGLLKKTKLQLTLVASGKECLEALDKSAFDIVLLDHMMPEMDGMETLVHIRENHPDQIVIALTANIMNGGAEFYKNAGFQDYLSKPVDCKDLETMLLDYLPKDKLNFESESNSASDTNNSQSNARSNVPDSDDDDEKLPAEYSWLYDVDSINVEDGIRFCGTAPSFVKFVGTFYDTIDEKSEEIQKAYEECDLSLYTIKVHALKSTTRIMGAKELSLLAEKLENAGNNKDEDFIVANTDNLLEMYRDYRNTLSRVEESRKASGKGEPQKSPISQTDLKNAYSALKEFVPKMDFDAVEMISSEIKGYELPEKDTEFFKHLDQAIKNVDWDAMEELIDNI